jgi:hypothetical protein
MLTMLLKWKCYRSRLVGLRRELDASRNQRSIKIPVVDITAISIYTYRYRYTRFLFTCLFSFLYFVFVFTFVNVFTTMQDWIEYSRRQKVSLGKASRIFEKAKTLGKMGFVRIAIWRKFEESDGTTRRNKTHRECWVKMERKSHMVCTCTAITLKNDLKSC